jgi:hypothetical protein
MLAEHNGSSKRGIIVKRAALIKQYLMKSIVLFENILAIDERG